MHGEGVMIRACFAGYARLAEQRQNQCATMGGSMQRPKERKEQYLIKAAIC